VDDSDVVEIGKRCRHGGSKAGNLGPVEWFAQLGQRVTPDLFKDQFARRVSAQPTEEPDDSGMRGRRERGGLTCKPRPFGIAPRDLSNHP
jgi:hypothetical protein